MSLGLCISLLLLSALPVCWQPFRTWVKHGVIMEGEFWVKIVVSKKGMQESKKGRKYFLCNSLKDCSLGTPRYCGNVVAFLGAEGISALWELQRWRMTSFGYRAVRVLSSRFKGDAFAPLTSKLPLAYWLANRENWFLTNSPVLRAEHSCHFQ